ncbi:uncharacterized protein LOC122313402 [Carya illinoinensis]|uniref:uncharacterized protein LOC122313402 n=1 Tax=Carya illinoinensis TaxID=32201 RepID=UPI001C71E12E|nr:uncharacterized protein LOC122313402 [Carya illinoinensis]
MCQGVLYHVNWKFVLCAGRCKEINTSMEQLYQGHPPIQYGRPGRNRDRRYGQGPTSNPQWEPSNDYQMSGDGRNYGAPQNHPPLQNYGPPRQGERGDRISMNNRNYAPGGMVN